jgi:hypothetical protein
MAWSLLNHMIADKVNELLDGQKDSYPPEVKRFYSREQAAAIIHAVLWGHASREDSTAACYAAMNLFDALGLKQWTFDEDEAAAFQELRQKRLREKYAALSPAERQTPPETQHQGTPKV